MENCKFRVISVSISAAFCVKGSCKKDLCSKNDSEPPVERENAHTKLFVKHYPSRKNTHQISIR